MNVSEMDTSFMKSRNIMTTVAPNSVMAYVLLVMMVNGCLYYMNVMPALVGALIDGAGFTKQQAGYVVSVNMYGSALGALLATLFIKKMPWKRVMFMLLVPFIALDFLSAFVPTPTGLMVIRFCSGVLAGFIATSSFAMMARLSHPDRAFGLLYAVALGLAGIGVYVLPGLVASWGTIGLFSLLVFFGFLALLALLFLPNFQLEKTQSSTQKAPHVNFRLTLLLVLAAIFLFQMSNMSMFAYLQRLGLDAGLELDWVSLALAGGLWVAIPSSLLVVAIGLRFGQAKPAMLGGTLALVGYYLLHHAANAEIFLCASLLVSVAATIIMPYLFGVCAALDPTGQGTAAGALASKLGLATGPLIGGWLLGSGSYPVLINVAIVAVILSVISALLAIGRMVQAKAQST